MNNCKDRYNEFEKCMEDVLTEIGSSFGLSKKQIFSEFYVKQPHPEKQMTEPKYKKSATEWCIECIHVPKPNGVCKECRVTHAVETSTGVEIGQPTNFTTEETCQS